MPVLLTHTFWFFSSSVEMFNFTQMLFHGLQTKKVTTEWSGQEMIFHRYRVLLLSYSHNDQNLIYKGLWGGNNGIPLLKEMYHYFECIYTIPKLTYLLFWNFFNVVILKQLNIDNWNLIDIVVTLLSIKFLKFLWYLSLWSFCGNLIKILVI